MAETFLLKFIIIIKLKFIIISLKQGDLLSPILFNFVLDVWLYVMKKIVI